MVGMEDVPDAQGAVADWLAGIGFGTDTDDAGEQTETAIHITIGRITSGLSVFDDLGSREDVTFSIAQ